MPETDTGEKDDEHEGFEAHLSRLEDAVAKLEDGNLSLDE